MPAAKLNFHHLHHFWSVAKDGNLTRTAGRLRVAPSALSAQIRQLEDELGQPLFRRERRSLVLTEAGQLVLAHAEAIFDTGRELVATLHRGRSRAELLCVGAVATLSRNFQESFVAPLFAQPGVTLRLHAGRLDDLLGELAAHAIDVVLANQPAERASGRAWRSRRLARQPVSIVGRPRTRRFRFAADLRGARMIVPGRDSAIRAEFDAICGEHGVAVTVLAEVDDMATMRLLARDTDALALLPSVVVRDELRAGVLQEHCLVPGLFETFYAITVARRFPHPLLLPLMAREADDLLAMHDGA